jgi:hypothetical protein
MGFEKVIPNELSEDGIYLKSLVLVRHLKIWAWRIDELGFGSEEDSNSSQEERTGVEQI